jgi:hypothetical protein
VATDRNIGKGESLQVRAPVIVSIMMGLLILVMVVAFGLTIFFPDRIGVRFVPRHTFPAPAVIPDERGQRLGLQARQQRALNGAGGRLPIAAAMRQIASRGDHAFDPVGP